MRCLSGLAAFAGAIAASSALAHVFWIQPRSFVPEPGKPLGVEIRVGEAFPGEARVRDDKKIVRFVAWGPGSKEATPIAGKNGEEPAGTFSPTEPGVWVLGYTGNPTSITLTGEQFEAYLKEEGLDRISKRRAAEGKASTGASEIYSRFAKSVVAAGGRSGPGFDRVLGMRLELVPLDDPTALGPGGELRVRALFQGKPAPDITVRSLCSTTTSTPAPVVTDAKGEATVKINAPGVWVLAAVEMTEAPKDSGADWESFWASLTFEVSARAPDPK